MNDQSKMMKSQAPLAQMIGPTSSASSQMMNQPLPPGPPQLIGQSSQMMLNRNYGMWPQPPVNNNQFNNPFINASANATAGQRSNNWKGKKGIDNSNNINKRKDMNRRHDQQNINAMVSNSIGGVSLGIGGYKPPALTELQSQNRAKAKKFYHQKKKFNNRFAPYAPRNTTSFIIRAKKSGGITSLVSPCPVTPAVLPTPIFSPSREVLGDTAKEEWGVDGYGSMKGLIRLRSPGNDGGEDDDEEGGGSSESDVEEHVEVERRLDHDLSRFEMIYPNNGGGGGGVFDYSNNVFLENRVDDQDTHIAQLEEENLTLKERLFLMEREMSDMRRRLLSLERRSGIMVDVNEEVVENMSDNDTESSGKLGGEYNNEMMGYVARGGRDRVVDSKENNEEAVEYNEGKDNNLITKNEGTLDNKVAVDVSMEEFDIPPSGKAAVKSEAKDLDVKDETDIKAICKEVAEGQMEDFAIVHSEELIQDQEEAKSEGTTKDRLGRTTNTVQVKMQSTELLVAAKDEVAGDGSLDKNFGSDEH